MALPCLEISSQGRWSWNSHKKPYVCKPLNSLYISTSISKGLLVFHARDMYKVTFLTHATCFANKSSADQVACRIERAKNEAPRGCIKMTECRSPSVVVSNSTSSGLNSTLIGTSFPPCYSEQYREYYATNYVFSLDLSILLGQGFTCLSGSITIIRSLTQEFGWQMLNLSVSASSHCEIVCGLLPDDSHRT